MVNGCVMEYSADLFQDCSQSKVNDFRPSYPVVFGQHQIVRSKSGVSKNESC